MAEYLYGNAVYNYGSAAPAEVPVFPEREEQTPRPEAVPRPREQEVVRTGVVAEPRSRVQMSLFVLVFAPVLLLSAVMLLFSYMKLNTLSDQSAAMVTQLQELKADQTRLKIKYESTFDLAEVETYAKTVLQKWYSDWERRLDSLARKVQAYFR